MSESRHLSEAQLARAIDGEATVIEQAEIDEHLIRCESCLEKYEALAEFSGEVETAINATAVQPPRDARERLIRAMESDGAMIATRARGHVRAWAWAAAAAAVLTLAFIGLRAPKPQPQQEIATVHEPANSLPSTAQIDEPAAPVTEPTPRRAVAKHSRAALKRQQTVTEVSASGFMRLPYADAALPMQTAGLVRVRMQLSMLAHAGVIQMLPGAPDAPVEADLLLGIDGQPYAVRLVSAKK